MNIKINIIDDCTLEDSRPTSFRTFLITSLHNLHSTQPKPGSLSNSGTSEFTSMSFDSEATTPANSHSQTINYSKRKIDFQKRWSMKLIYYTLMIKLLF